MVKYGRSCKNGLKWQKESKSEKNTQTGKTMGRTARMVQNGNNGSHS